MKRSLTMFIIAGIFFAGCAGTQPNVATVTINVHTQPSIHSFYTYERRCKKRNPQIYQKVCKTVLIKHKS
tara:strand:+ start:93 stop:302 length:210 start_codon:yes stop_codon:yes gene_type:complete